MATQANFVFNELLTGEVNGVNKVFTSAYPIDIVESLRIATVDYQDFTFDWSVVTLADAPTVSLWAPRLDYFRADVSPPIPPSSKTFLELRNEIFEDIGQFATSKQYPYTMVERYIKETIPLHLNQKVNPFRKIGTYSFNKAVDCFASSYSATTIPVGSVPTYAPGTWMVLIKKSTPVTYGWTTSSEFTSLNGLNIVYSAWDKIVIGYNMPTWVKKPSTVRIGWEELEYKDFRQFNLDEKNFYTTYEGFIFLPFSTKSQIVDVCYTKENIIPEAYDDILDFEPNYESVLRYDVIRKMFVFREDTRLDNVEALYREALKLYKSYIAKQTNEINWVMRSGAFKQFNNVRGWR